MLQAWEKEAVGVSHAHFQMLRFTQGNNFTCAEEPAHPLTPAPTPLGLPSFAMGRTEIKLPKGDAAAVAALLFVTAAEVHTNRRDNDGDVQARRLLGQFKLYVGGALLGIGPGRGDDNSSTPYDTFDISSQLAAATASGAGTLAIGLQGYNPNRTAAKMMLEVHMIDAAGRKTIFGTNAAGWITFESSRVFGLGLSNLMSTGGAYFQPQERIDGPLYPHGWRLAGFNEGQGWAPAEERPPFARHIVPKSTQSISVSVQTPPTEAVEVAPGSYFYDFGAEMQANVILTASVPAELAGLTVAVTLGESLSAVHTIRTPGFTGNRFAASFVLGAGNNISLETHEYMEFRYATLAFANASAATQVKFELAAAVVRYPWVPTDSAFASSSAVLADVYRLCKTTLQATSLDTYTDSNTRERLPSRMLNTRGLLMI